MPKGSARTPLGPKGNERREDTGALWQILLNCLLSEPLISIYVDESPVIFLADTGSEVNCVSNTLIEQIGYTDRVQPTKFRCCGPSGEPLRATGEVYLDFTLGNRVYSAKYIVLELHAKTTGILGYNFMKSNDIIIYCGKQ